MIPAWTPVDYGFDIYTPRKVPEYPHWIALDCFYFIVFCMVTFLSVVIDSKLLQESFRCHVSVRRRWRENRLPRNMTYVEAYTRDLCDIAHELLAMY